MILLVDNYDSFTFNLVHSLWRAGAEVVVRRNDDLPVGVARAETWEAIVLSPGPGGPEEAGDADRLLAECPPDLPVLGVCLGHQLLVRHYGGKLELDPAPVHGRASAVRHAGTALFEGLPDPFEAARYHSIRARSLPAVLERTAWTEEGHVMGARHRELPRHGVQFHPESILTPAGDRLVANFVRMARERGISAEGENSGGASRRSPRGASPRPERP